MPRKIKGDLLLFYHSNEGLNIVGIAKLVKEHFQDPSTDEVAWLAVQISPYKALKMPVSLVDIKKNAKLKTMQLLRLARLSVSAVTEDEFNEIIKMSEK